MIMLSHTRILFQRKEVVKIFTTIEENSSVVCKTASTPIQNSTIVALAFNLLKKITCTYG